MSESDRINEWAAFCRASRKTCQAFEPDKVLFYLTSPYMQSRQVGDAVMKKLGLPSLHPFIEWARDDK